VWLAEDELLRRLVALKQDILSGPTCVGSYSAAPDRLLIEACAAATVNHKGAITIYDVVTDDDRNWIVMEPLFGRTLAEVIAAEGPLPVAQVTNIGLGLLDVLQAAHRVGILHCDVKPPNVHLCDDGRVVLTDFGIACSLVDEPSNPTQMLAASPVYTAPERLRGGKPEPASDLFFARCDVVRSS
jgi:serine/threonine protein kinase